MTGRTSFVMNGCVSSKSLTAISKPGDQIVASGYIHEYEVENRDGATDGVGAWVETTTTYDLHGNVVEAYAVKSTQREFESPAVQAVMKWKFKPGRKGGRAVNTKMQVPIVFNLSDE